MTEAEVVQPAAPPSADARLSVRGLVEVFYKPTEFFKRLVLNPKILVPYIALGVLVVIAILASMNVFYSWLSSQPKYQEQMANAMSSLDADKVALAKQNAEFYTKLFYGVGLILGYLLLPLIAAFLGWFWGNFVYAGRAGYRQLLSIFLYAEIIYAVGMVARLALQLPTGNFMASLSLYVMAPSLPYDGFLASLLDHISVFHIWEIIAAAVGLSAVYGFSKGRGYMLSLLSVGLFSIVPVLWIGIKSIF